MEREGALIAGKIRRMMAGDPTLRYRDFAILTRSKATAFSAMMPVLLAQGIPAYADGQAGYFESVEISWLTSMLRLIANGRSDVELIAMLRSPAVGLTADELARIRIAHRNEAYVDAAKAYAEGAEDDIARKLWAFFEQLAGWRLKSGSLGLGEFVRLVLDESGFYTYAGALPGGAQRQANLDQFVASASGFDGEFSGSLTRFLAYTEHLRQKGDGDAAHLLGENDNVVRLMSVHKSKGLEFRVVFGAQLAKKYRVEKSDAPLVTHRDLGVGMSYFDPELRTRRLTLPQAAIMARQRREDAAEEMRILYVLLTRAQEKLVLVGTVKGAEKAMKRWQALAAAPFAAASHLDLIMAARCGAEAEGLPLHSELEVIPAASMRRRGGGGEARRRKALFERVMAHPEAYADAGPGGADGLEVSGPAGRGQAAEADGLGAAAGAGGAGGAARAAGAPGLPLRGRAAHDRRGAGHGLPPLHAAAGPGRAGRPLGAGAGPGRRATAGRLRQPAAADGRPAGGGGARRLARFLEERRGPAAARANAGGGGAPGWPSLQRYPAGGALAPEEAGRFGGGELLVQGTIDCCFVEDGQWVLLDYKTDRTDDMDALRAHYEKQLKVYALALERITGMPVKQRLLCLLSSGGTLEV